MQGGSLSTSPCEATYGWSLTANTVLSSLSVQTSHLCLHPMLEHKPKPWKLSPKPM
ncbi:unnamed protein product [Brassica oleracea]|nr:unnamed protein product [Brassica napus]